MMSLQTVAMGSLSRIVMGAEVSIAMKQEARVRHTDRRGSDLPTVRQVA